MIFGSVCSGIEAASVAWKPLGPRYKALGNSWAVPLVRKIGERIQMVEGILDGR